MIEMLRKNLDEQDVELISNLNYNQEQLLRVNTKNPKKLKAREDSDKNTYCHHYYSTL